MLFVPKLHSSRSSRRAFIALGLALSSLITYVSVLVYALHWPVADAMISFSNLGFSAALIPGILENFRRREGWNLTTAISTTVLLANTALALWILGAVLGSITALMTTITWGVLALQAAYFGSGVKTR